MQKLKSIWTSLFLLFNTLLITVCLIPIPPSIPKPFSRTDLIVHLAGYGLAAILGCRAFKPYFIRILCSLIFQGIAIEIIQPYVGRSFDYTDIYANTLGVIIGFIIFKQLSRLFPSM